MSQPEKKRGRKPLSEAQLWQRYKEKGEMRHRDALLGMYTPLINFTISRHKMWHLRANRLMEPADLRGWGLIGLLQAIERYDPGKGFKFPTFACARIRGAVLDGLRDFDQISRYLKEELKLLGEGKEKGRKRLKLMDIAYKLSEHFPERVLGPAQTAKHIPHIRGQEEGGFVKAVENERAGLLQRAIEQLPERTARIVRLHGLEGFSLKETGRNVGVCESRICQLFKQALRTLKTILSPRLSIVFIFLLIIA